MTINYTCFNEFQSSNTSFIQLDKGAATITTDAVKSLKDENYTNSIWCKIVDFFCGTKRCEAKACLHTMIHSTVPKDKTDAFERLRALTATGHQYKFSIESSGALTVLTIDGHGGSLTCRFINNEESLSKGSLKYEKSLLVPDNEKPITFDEEIKRPFTLNIFHNALAKFA